MGILEGKVVLVTGGANGIGKESALLAAKEGAQVVVNDLGGGVAGGAEGSAAPAEQTAQAIRQAGGQAVSNSDSVTSRDGVKRMIEQAMDSFKGLHAIISPAGILRDTMFHKMTDADWDQVIEVHLQGSYNICRAAVNHFREQNEGSFVLFTSTSGLIGNVGQANYAAAKAGLIGLTKTVALEVAKRGITVNAVAPGFIDTDMTKAMPVAAIENAIAQTPVQQLGQPEEVARLVRFLLDEKAGYITGAVYNINGGWYM